MEDLEKLLSEMDALIDSRWQSMTEEERAKDKTHKIFLFYICKLIKWVQCKDLKKQGKSQASSVTADSTMEGNDGGEDAGEEKKQGLQALTVAW